MNKILVAYLLLIISLNANTHDKSYTCIAFQKNLGDKAEKLDMRESIAKGGWFSLSVKVNFLQAIVSRDKDTINNIKFEDMRFAYRITLKGFNAYVHDYDKEYFLIEKGNILKPHFDMKLLNGDRLYYQCTMYTETNTTNK